MARFVFGAQLQTNDELCESAAWTAMDWELVQAQIIGKSCGVCRICFSRTTNHELRITSYKSRNRKAGGRTLSCVIGMMAAAGCDPCLSFDDQVSGQRQVHIVLRCGQFGPQRQNNDAPARLELECVDVRAPFAEPKMSDRV